MSKYGKLFGIGVGPGDPELLTIKAVRLIQKADVIFTAASTKNSYSLAVEIAKPHLSDSAKLVSLSFPMTDDKGETNTAWNDNAEKIADVLKQGKDAAFLTLGDPTTYSTFGYILKSLEKVMPQADIETVPGITSFHAAAARLNRVLVEGEESLLITSGAYGGENLNDISKNVQKLVMMKAYKNTKKINTALKENDFYNNSIAISKCGRDGEEIIENLDDLETKKPDYWTLILAGR
ncbi:MAG: precorrin-2 C(20)-methyltransferase [Thermodesulfobacteriota bacterium]|nr:precorrin-2 C(20)-methyltransferase [Thermodesulfobacteriota bacterium]